MKNWLSPSSNVENSGYAFKVIENGKTLPALLSKYRNLPLAIEPSKRWVIDNKKYTIVFLDEDGNKVSESGFGIEELLDYSVIIDQGKLTVEVSLEKVAATEKSLSIIGTLCAKIISVMIPKRVGQDDSHKKAA